MEARPLVHLNFSCTDAADPTNVPDEPRRHEQHVDEEGGAEVEDEVTLRCALRSIEMEEWVEVLRSAGILTKQHFTERISCADDLPGEMPVLVRRRLAKYASKLACDAVDIQIPRGRASDEGSVTESLHDVLREVGAQMHVDTLCSIGIRTTADLSRVAITDDLPLEIPFDVRLQIAERAASPPHRIEFKK